MTQAPVDRAPVGARATRATADGPGVLLQCGLCDQYYDYAPLDRKLPEPLTVDEAREGGMGKRLGETYLLAEPSIRFYESLGARVQSGWSTFRLTGDALAAVAAS